MYKQFLKKQPKKKELTAEELAYKQLGQINKSLTNISNWMTWFGILSVIYMILQVINFILSI